MKYQMSGEGERRDNFENLLSILFAASKAQPTKRQQTISVLGHFLDTQNKLFVVSLLEEQEKKDIRPGVISVDLPLRFLSTSSS